MTRRLAVEHVSRDRRPGDPPSWLHVDWLRWAFTLKRCGMPSVATGYVQDPTGLTWSFEPTAALGTPRFKRAIGESVERRGRIGRSPPPGDAAHSRRWRSVLRRGTRHPQP